MKTGKIYLTKDIAHFNIPDIKGKNLCILAKGFQKPEIKNCIYLNFEIFKKDARNYLQNIDNLIFVGNSRIINPANRIEPVFEIIHNNTPDLNKIIIDNTLFVSDVWRIIFAFITVNAKYDNYTYSYLAQTDWNKYDEKLSKKNPFSIENVLRWSKDVVYCDYKKFFDVKYNQIITNDEVKQQYLLLKNKLFFESEDVGYIIRELSKFCDNFCLGRNIPKMNNFFQKDRHIIFSTDLNVDNYFVSKIKEMEDYVNTLSEGLWLQ